MGMLCCGDGDHLRIFSEAALGNRHCAGCVGAVTPHPSWRSPEIRLSLLGWHALTLSVTWAGSSGRVCGLQAGPRPRPTQRVAGRHPAHSFVWLSRIQAGVMFVIEDELHAEPQGEFSSREDALEELKRRSTIPWNEAPNVAPCTSWETCGRQYVLIEYNESWVELSRIPVLNVSSSSVKWLIEHR